MVPLQLLMNESSKAVLRNLMYLSHGMTYLEENEKFTLSGIRPSALFVRLALLATLCNKALYSIANFSCSCSKAICKKEKTIGK